MHPEASPRPTVFLFDIDGTLINTAGAGRRAMTRTFEERYQRDDACAGIAFGGMTDRAILRGGLGAIGVPADDAAIDALLAHYLTLLQDEMDRATSCTIPAGIVAALDAIEARGDVALGLGTGNIEEGAQIKLRKVGLAERFAFGGYGSDHEDRPTLIGIGAERGARRLARPREHCRVVIVGDTPKDIHAAQAIGAECIAVATGGFTVEALAPHRPTRVFRDLAEPGALAALLGA
jgi:phosphoglycolate phosphatase-like HAD superfamily hydrolase